MANPSQLATEARPASPSAMPRRHSAAVRNWLLLGLLLIFVQIVVGGITRLTGSGLSITKWEIVTGTLPPLSPAAWEEAFALYKATPQYQKLNTGMGMADFKFIYFWEYIHRLWARMMGLAFVLPFVFFWRRRMLSPALMRHLGIVVLLAAFTASFGWIMVASGLVDRPWVNAYKLSLHLSVALLTFSALLWTALKVIQPEKQVIHNLRAKKWTLGILLVLSIQIFLGGMMSGMKAGLLYPTFPDMLGHIVPPTVLDPSHWTVENFVDYDQHNFMGSLVQVLHRFTAYLLIMMVLYFAWASRKMGLTAVGKRYVQMLVIAVLLQASLGIITVLLCQGTVPVLWGVLHQAGAIVLLAAALGLRFQLVRSSVL